MNKMEAQKLQETYNMEILRHDITREAFGLRIVSKKSIPELDALVDANILPCTMQDMGVPGIQHDYRLTCPTDWFDLYGWVD